MASQEGCGAVDSCRWRARGVQGVLGYGSVWVAKGYWWQWACDDSGAGVPMQGKMHSGRQRIHKTRWFPEEEQRMYELAAENAEHTLGLTTGTAAVCCRNAWWEQVAQAV